MKLNSQKIFIGIIAVLVICTGGYIFAQETVQNKTPENAEKIVSEDKKWFEKSRLIFHALGAIDGAPYTNSKEAFVRSYENGAIVLEADFSVTSDQVLVLRHDFNDGLQDLDTFLKTKINDKYTPLSAKDLMQLMIDHEDIYIVTDTKDGNLDKARAEFEMLVKEATELGHPEVLDRFVVQIYWDAMFDVIHDVYPFQNWIYTLYQQTDPDYKKIADFCVEKGIDVVTMPYKTALSKRIQIFDDHNIAVYVHTLNDIAVAEKYFEAGVRGIYTDTIVPADLSETSFAEE